MDKNRKILLSIFIFLVLSVVLSLVNISMNMNKSQTVGSKLSVPDVTPGVGVVRITGPITMNGEGGAFEVAPGAEEIISRLNDLSKDIRVKAIVVRIDSPGGTVGATQEIFQKIMKLRRKNIPIVASMGDLAASGGYYSASACSYIYANQGTITGSIGVIVAAPNLKGLFEKIGVKMNVIKSGKYKDILSASRDLSDEEKKILQDMIDSTYQQFLKDVSLGRNIPIDDFKDYADGRIMSGVTAKEVKLIDEIGTFEDAIAKARELAKLKEDSPVYDDVKSPLEQIIGKIEGRLGSNPLEAVVKQNSSILEYRYIP